ncbi:type I-E CRISPR-associated protein Cse1/CasA [Erwinia endophytica]|uniref:type I-E CRISPR-associated protein Cse1/CasA n=1 Tax=Erwinia endophytica TaxID=1563158 RepID=UPI001265DAF9|nr:type I-E CRISPR-associated protein Cse1/CasA [Erwinia endophytica]KAB8306225.1 type I-E CRISPR-associated protein Cse1/CasA [Erwinia endophytica]
MNLLTDSWIPVRPLTGGEFRQINLQTLLCDPQPWLLALPRDDMEMAACQLLISMVQLLWPPEELAQILQHIQQPLSEHEFIAGIAGWEQSFDLNHPEHPFMQVRGVTAKELTGMDKLLVGLTGSTSCAFVNQPGQGDALCGGCAAIALFNQANNAPGFGGGFKSGLRGGAPMTTLIQQRCLRTTLWMNVLTAENLDKHYPDWQQQLHHSFTWQQPIASNEKIHAQSIGLARGLFWQPAHIELSPPASGGQCSGCGAIVETRYLSFLKAKFNYTIEGFWLHPHSPVVMQIKKGITETRHIGFTQPVPCWTQVSRLLITQQLEKKQEGRSPALVVKQGRQLANGKTLHLSIGGYRNNQAAIIERRHEVMVFNQGWDRHLDIINEIVDVGLAYRSALRKALYLFVEGMRESNVIGAGLPLHEVADRQYYRQSDATVSRILATINYEQPLKGLETLHQHLSMLCLQLFERITDPYTHHPKLILTLAIARRVLIKQLSALKM